MLDEFRKQMDKIWEEADRKAMASKSSQGAVLDLFDYYKTLSKKEQEMASHILCEWIGSDNDRKVFDALATIDKFCIKEARKRLEEYVLELKQRMDHETLFHLKKIQRILNHLDS